MVTKKHAVENIGIFSPGPGAYSPKVLNTGGGQLGDKPQYSLRPVLEQHQSKAVRTVSSNPGPGTYDSRVSKTGHGTWTDTPNVSFGTSCKLERPEESLPSTRLISAAHTRENQGLFSPGPAAYKQQATMGKHTPRSVGQSSPRFGFGSSPRPWNN